MRKYFYYAVTTFKSMKVYKLDLVLKVVGAVIIVTAMREIWLSMYRNAPALAADAGVEAGAMATYAIVSIIVSMLLAPGMAGEMGNKVTTGTIVTDLMKPWNWMLMYLAKSAASMVFSLVFVVVPLILALSLLYPINVPSAGILTAFAACGVFPAPRPHLFHTKFRLSRKTSCLQAAFLGFCTWGNFKGPIKIRYTDGTEEKRELALSDWVQVQTSPKGFFSDELAFTFPYCHQEELKHDGVHGFYVNRI